MIILVSSPVKKISTCHKESVRRLPIILVDISISTGPIDGAKEGGESKSEEDGKGSGSGGAAVRRRQQRRWHPQLSLQLPHHHS